MRLTSRQISDNEHTNNMPISVLSIINAILINDNYCEEAFTGFHTPNVVQKEQISPIVDKSYTPSVGKCDNTFAIVLDVIY